MQHIESASSALDAAAMWRRELWEAEKDAVSRMVKTVFMVVLDQATPIREKWIVRDWNIL
jgi:hypothetical protein